LTTRPCPEKNEQTLLKNFQSDLARKFSNNLLTLPENFFRINRTLIKNFPTDPVTYTMCGKSEDALYPTVNWKERGTGHGNDAASILHVTY
jgi:hypothetical protein